MILCFNDKIKIKHKFIAISNNNKIRSKYYLLMGILDKSSKNFFHHWKIESIIKKEL